MKELTTNELAESRDQRYHFVDIRSTQEFASGFLSGSVFLSPDENFFQNLRLFFASDAPVIIIADSDPENLLTLSSGAAKDTEDRIGGYAVFNREKFETVGLSVDLMVDVEPDELGMDIKFDENILLVDLRDPESFSAGHIEGAIPMPLSELADVAQIAALDEEGHVYFYADDPQDSYTAASLLKKQGMHDVRVIAGSWQQITKEKSIRIVSDKTKK